MQKEQVNMRILIDYSVITCDEIIDKVDKSYDNVADTVSINSYDKKQHVKWTIIIFYCFLLVTILLLEIITICYYFIQH